MILFREAKLSDASGIAEIHALSWRQNYHVALSAAFLKSELDAYMQQKWSERLSQTNDHQYIVLAEESNQLIGFACAYYKKEEEWGTLLDNLHVLGSEKGRGVGRLLMQQLADWLRSKDPKSTLHLWVLEDNHRAIRFYEKMGGEKIVLEAAPMPDGGSPNAYKIGWRNLSSLGGKG